MRRSHYTGNLSRMNDIAEELQQLNVGKDKKQSAVLLVHGSTAMDAAATTEIRQSLVGMGDINIVDMRLLSSHASLDGQMQPAMAYLASGTDLDATLQTFMSDASEKYGLYLSKTNNVAETFPQSAPMEQDTSGSATSCSVTTPENERRCFTFIAEDDREDDELPTRAQSAMKASVHTSIAPMSPEPGRRSSLAATPRRVGVVPATTTTPSIVPRMTKSAALRLGIPIPEASTSRLSPRPSSRASIDGSDRAVTPGVVKRSVTPPRSLAGPSITPRETKASRLRQAGEAAKSSVTPGKAYIRPPTQRRESCGTSERSAGFEGLPGFSKRPALAATSPAPRSAPRATISSSLREEPSIGTSNVNASPFAKPKATVRRQSLSTAERAAQAKAQHQTKVDRRRSLASLMAPSIQPRLNKASQLRGAEDQQTF